MMHAKTHLLIVFAISLVAPSVQVSALENARDRYIYDGIMSGQSIEIYPEGGALAIGESLYDADYCSSSSAFICFTSSPFAFAVPKTGVCNEGSWAVAGRKYTVTARLQQRKIIGRMAEVCIIESLVKQDNDSISSRFLYSPKGGLLAMEVRDNAGGRWPGDIYVARDAGFGSVAR